MAGGGLGTSQRVAEVTIEKWIKKVSELTVRNLVLLAKLSKKGLMQYGADGHQMRWPIRKSEHQLNPFPDAVPVGYVRKNTKDNAYLGWRGYYLSDTITLREKLEQGGPAAMIKIFNSREKLIRETAMRRLAYEFYKDGGSAAGIAAERIHGIETLFSTIGAQTASDVLATAPQGTYAGLSMVPGAVSTETDMTRIWTPNGVNTNRNPGSGAQSWEANADEFIRAGLIRTTYGNSEGDRPDLITTTQEAYEQLCNILDGKERLVVNRGQSADLVSMGFTNVIEVDGCPVMWDLACPTTDANGDVVQGYGWTTDRLEFHLLGSEKQVFKAEVTFNDTYRADNIFVYMLGNLRFESPRYFMKFAAIS